MDKPPHNEIDDVIHQRTRLSIMASLAGVASMNFNELKADLALTDGNLSTHLSYLEKAQYVKITKKFKGKKPQTTVAVSAKGKTALQKYIEQLETIIRKTK
jgi:DNA-binding MarR family transcriptional regulator